MEPFKGPFPPLMQRNRLLLFWKWHDGWIAYSNPGGGKGGTLGISGWGCAAGTLEPLAYTRASFSWILLPYTRVNFPNHSYPRVAVFQKLRSLAQSKTKPKQNFFIKKRIYLYLSSNAKNVRTHYQDNKLFNFNQY